MIVLNVTYKCKPGMREAFREALRAEGLDVMCRREDGNFKYDYYMSTEDPDEMVLIENWRDEDALTVHKGQAHFARIGEVKNEYVITTDIKKYEG